MYQSESMIQMLEDMQHQANEMEKSIKDMLEVEGRAIGIELDKRKNARDLFNELSEKQNEIAEEQAQEMTWAYVPCELAEQDANCYVEVPSPVEANVVLDHDEVNYEEANVEVAPEVVEEAVEEVAPEVMPEEANVEVAPEHSDPVNAGEAFEMESDAPVVEDAPAPEVAPEEVVEDAPVQPAPVIEDPNQQG